jgi:hypothetical protein
MRILDHLTPRKLEEHGIEQESMARDLLQDRRDELSQPNRNKAKGLLDA